MFNLAVTFIAAALLAPSAALGQDLTPCVTNCTTIALPDGGCTSLTDLTCVCSSQAFLTSASACITQDCPDQLASAIAAQTAACAAVTNGTDSSSAASDSTTAGTGVTTPAAGTTTRAAGTTTTRAPTSSSSSRAASSTSTSTGAGFHTASIASGVTLALFGAAFSLF